MQSGGFNLRKWHSNSNEVMQEIKRREKVVVEIKKGIGEDDESYAKSTITKNNVVELSDNKILGLNWNSADDKIVFKLLELTSSTQEQQLTKRVVLSTIAKIFDPLGLISPITTTLKVFMQQLFRDKLGWDEPLSADLAIEWNDLMLQFQSVKEVAVPRYCFGDIRDRPEKIWLFGFCDSSEKAYSALVYAKVNNSQGSAVSLITSKTRVAPLKKMTIPRLELLSCLILARLINSVKETLSCFYDVHIERCWTDSITAFYWIQGTTKEWKLFVHNRVQEIRNLTSVDLWSHCPGKENPADLPTRKSNISKLAGNSSWWNGPYWLKEGPENWPQRQISLETPELCLLEMKEEKLTAVAENSTFLNTSSSEYRLSDIINPERFSSYDKLLRITAYVRRFLKGCKGKQDNLNINLTTNEINSAERLWLREIQLSFTASELKELNLHLGTYTDNDGIIRCQGRLDNSTLQFETRHPVLLPRDNNVTFLIILKSHELMLHNGAKETLSNLRSKFWIVKGRQLVKKITRNCYICKRILGKCYGNPKTAQLPDFRVREEHPFTSVGIDFAGPLYVKSDKDAMTKVYIALFTCGTSRAVHLELVPDLSVATFMLCFRRFASRRGIPSVVISDNAKTFKSFSKQLANLFRSEEMQSYLQQKRITWKFNLAKAPWWGGFYERLIKNVKLCLKKCVGRARLSIDELNTVLIEIEGVLNCRPLTYVYSDELVEPLTPSHLLTGRRILQLPYFSTEDDDGDYNSTAVSFQKRARYVELILKHYQRRWKSEYLVSLREHHRMSNGGKQIEIKEGDVVTVQDENLKNRVYWRLAKIVQLIVGKDNVVRGAKLLLPNGNHIERPIQKLYPLEVSQKEFNQNEKREEVKAVERPKRNAAVIARERMDIIDQLERDDEL